MILGSAHGAVLPCGQGAWNAWPFSTVTKGNLVIVSSARSLHKPLSLQAWKNDIEDNVSHECSGAMPNAPKPKTAINNITTRNTCMLLASHIKYPGGEQFSLVFKEVVLLDLTGVCVAFWLFCQCLLVVNSMKQTNKRIKFIYDKLLNYCKSKRAHILPRKRKQKGKQPQTPKTQISPITYFRANTCYIVVG